MQITLFFDKSREGSNSGVGCLEKSLSVKSGVHGHNKDHVSIGDNIVQCLNRGSGIQRNPGTDTGITYQFKKTDREMCCFVMNGNHPGIERYKAVNRLFRGFYHKVYVKRDFRMGHQITYIAGAKGHVGDELAVHNIHMQKVDDSRIEFIET